jgi:hypothetical protein
VRPDGKLRIGLQFHFAHPLPLLPRRQQDAQITL